MRTKQAVSPNKGVEATRMSNNLTQASTAEHNTRNHSHILQLQKAVGNRAVMQMMQAQVAQRQPHSYQSKDNAIDNYITALDKLVNTSATNALQLGNVPSDSGGYLDRWHGLASQYCNDNTQIPNFIYAAYGYAVETLTNLNLSSIQSTLPSGWTVQTQVTHGMTRPDIVVLNDKKVEVAWLDITSIGSVGHIKNKAGGGWSSKDYVHEISYPTLDLGKITTTGSMIEGVKARNNLKMLEKKKVKALAKLRGDLEDLESLYDVSTLPLTRAAFIEEFEMDLSHDTIRSLITMAELDLEAFGYRRAQKTGRNKAAADEILYSNYISKITIFA